MAMLKETFHNRMLGRGLQDILADCRKHGNGLEASVEGA
jgi:hypothetical protein